jgi:preprotein translocase subunit YajC
VLIIVVLLILVTLFSIEVSVRKTVKQNAEIIELLSELQKKSEKD